MINSVFSTVGDNFLFYKMVSATIDLGPVGCVGPFMPSRPPVNRGGWVDKAFPSQASLASFRESISMEGPHLDLEAILLGNTQEEQDDIHVDYDALKETLNLVFSEMSGTEGYVENLIAGSSNVALAQFSSFDFSFVDFVKIKQFFTDRGLGYRVSEFLLDFSISHAHSAVSLSFKGRNYEFPIVVVDRFYKPLISAIPFLDTHADIDFFELLAAFETELETAGLYYCPINGTDIHGFVFYGDSGFSFENPSYDTNFGEVVLSCVPSTGSDSYKEDLFGQAFGSFVVRDSRQLLNKVFSILLPNRGEDGALKRCIQSFYFSREGDFFSFKGKMYESKSLEWVAQQFFEDAILPSLQSQRSSYHSKRQDILSSVSSTWV